MGELRSHRLCSVAKKKKRKTQTRANKTHLWAGRGPQYSQTLSGGVGKGREGPVEPLEWPPRGPQLSRPLRQSQPLPLLTNLPVVKSAQGEESGFQDRKPHGLSSCRSVFLILITSLGYFNFCKTINHKGCFFSSGSVLCNTLPTLALFLKQSVPLGAQGLGVPAHRTVRGGAWAPPSSLSPGWQPQAGPSAPNTRFRDRLGVTACFGSKVMVPNAPRAAVSLAAQSGTSREPL